MDKWHNQKLFWRGDHYFEHLLTSISNARHRIALEFFTLSMDEWGQKLMTELLKKVHEGLNIRLVIDAVGSYKWIPEIRKLTKNTSIHLKIHNPLPWQKCPQQGHFCFHNLNKRTHRKLAIIDGQKAYVGSVNIITDHSHGHKNKSAWDDIAIYLEGPQVSNIERSFNDHWMSKISPLQQNKKIRQSLLRHNSSPLYRKLFFHNLLYRIQKAQRKIELVSPYFIPSSSLQKALRNAVDRGVEVKIIVPEQSDFSFFPAINARFTKELSRYGIQIYEYRPRFLHAKLLLIDQVAIMGSSNFNSRSLLHDYELDVLLTDKIIVGKLRKRVGKLIRMSNKIYFPAILKRYPYLKIKEVVFEPLKFLF